MTRFSLLNLRGRSWELKCWDLVFNSRHCFHHFCSSSRRTFGDCALSSLFSLSCLGSYSYEEPQMFLEHYFNRLTTLLTYFESGKCVWGNVECGHLHVSEEVVELFWPQCDFGQWLMSDALPQHDTAVQCNLWRLIPAYNINIWKMISHFVFHMHANTSGRRMDGFLKNWKQEHSELQNVWHNNGVQNKSRPIWLQIFITIYIENLR